MIFFARKHKLVMTPFFEGFNDSHNHLLPAVDDGVKSLEESLDVLSYFEELKVNSVLLTPHVMVGVNNSDELVESAFETLKRAYKGPVKLSLASEYMLDSNFLGHFKRGARLMSQGNILVETSYLSAPVNFSEMLYEVASEGVTPIIAHPERYRYMPQSKYHSLKDLEYGFQLNLLSFTEVYGGTVSKNAIYMLERGMYDAIGTDLHSLRSFKSRIEGVKLSTKHVDMLLELKLKTL